MGAVQVGCDGGVAGPRDGIELGTELSGLADQQPACVPSIARLPVPELVPAQPKANSTSSVGYNHHSLLASIEDLFCLPHLGFATKPDLPRFGRDVFSAW